MALDHHRRLEGEEVERRKEQDPKLPNPKQNPKLKPKALARTVFSFRFLLIFHGSCAHCSLLFYSRHLPSLVLLLFFVLLIVNVLATANGATHVLAPVFFFNLVGKTPACPVASFWPSYNN